MKSLLVHLDASPRCAVRLALAHRIARDHGAALTALYAVMPSLITPYAASEGAWALASGFEELDRELRGRARALYEREAATGPVTWAELGSDPFATTVLEHALLADLLVLGQHDPEDAQTGALPIGFVPTLIYDSGKPALVVPRVGSYERVGDEVLVAWKASPEAAHAVSAALPLLRRARRVHLACAAPQGIEGRAGGNALEFWLRLQGVTAPVTMHSTVDDAPGEGLLSLAADTSADLLVMGCYGHGRAREWVLGGATRTVLQSMTLPVLMAH
ncbi:MAG: hypothetical protein ABT20_12270 [Rubrivivax sp. SCN 70-15]|jgi:nucleotide-binding universal stress UspA family protein|nr:MAG: hypothetical protein ABT20_12270 [Rubrivivax sp. SCN 70-15]